MDIIITKDKYGSLFAHTQHTLYPLFQFEYRETEEMGGPAWYFWLRGDYDADIFKGKRTEFPMNFFLDACRAKNFIQYGGSLTEDAKIIKGAGFLVR